MPPHSLDDGLASFVVKRYEPGAWVSSAEAEWFLVLNSGAQSVKRGSIVVITEGHQIVAYLHVADVETVTIP